MKPTRADFEPNLDRIPSVNVNVNTITITQDGIASVTVRTDVLASLLFAIANTMETLEDKAIIERLAKQSLGWK